MKMSRLENSDVFEHLTTLVCLDIMRNLDFQPQGVKTNQIPDYVMHKKGKDYWFSSVQLNSVI